ncbi:MAG: formylmethanofuran--tetrahydromethanopterin N-formyltransferase [Crenarchaeota archaeon]|nr:formylmethanofuran--tetrahydromethanopterin N-formyltransferase [Thermoproteota archaeon]
MVLKSEIEIVDTYAEAFEGIFCRAIITADDEQTLRSAAYDVTATPSAVIGRIEGGIERWLSKDETPDNRKGVIVQWWMGVRANKPLPDQLAKFETELSFRIRQDVLVKPFTAIFDALPNPEGKFDMMEKVGHCGDGYEWTENRYGREIIVVPIMVPDFIIERYLGYAHGVSGANFWILCETKQAVLEAGQKALNAVQTVTGAITTFDICSAGSKPETNFPQIGPTTNHEWCPSLKQRLGEKSKVPQKVGFIPELVISGVSMDAVKAAMKAGIEAAISVKGVTSISAGNYDGKLGKYKIYLRELFQ